MKEKDPRSKEELLAEIRFLKQGSIAEQIGVTVQIGIKFGAIAFIAWCGKEAITSLAGSTTEASILISFLSKVEISEALAWIFGIGSIGYGYSQRKLKGQTVERLQSRITMLESKIDPDRSSSNLTKRGETNPKDRL
jgi:hypothetical protein